MTQPRMTFSVSSLLMTVFLLYARGVHAQCGQNELIQAVTGNTFTCASYPLQSCGGGSDQLFQEGIICAAGSFINQFQPWNGQVLTGSFVSNALSTTRKMQFTCCQVQGPQYWTLTNVAVQTGSDSFDCGSGGALMGVVRDVYTQEAQAMCYKLMDSVPTRVITPTPTNPSASDNSNNLNNNNSNNVQNSVKSSTAVSTPSSTPSSISNSISNSNSDSNSDSNSNSISKSAKTSTSSTVSPPPTPTKQPAGIKQEDVNPDSGENQSTPPAAPTTTTSPSNENGNGNNVDATPSGDPQSDLTVNPAQTLGKIPSAAVLSYTTASSFLLFVTLLLQLCCS